MVVGFFSVSSGLGDVCICDGTFSQFVWFLYKKEA